MSLDRVINISDREVASYMTPEDFVNSCDEAFRLYEKGEMVNPPREESLLKEDGMEVFQLVLRAQWPGKYRGQKVIEERSDIKSGRLGHRMAKIELEDLSTGHRIFFDAEHITNMRTGAAGVLGAKYLCPCPVSTVAILGTGRIATALALCADVVLKPEVIQVTSRKQVNREAFAEEVADRLMCKLIMTKSLETCVSGADAVLASVPTPKPVLDKDMLAKNVHISVLGGDGRTQQLEQALFLSRTVVPDHPTQVLNSGEFLSAQREGHEILWSKNKAGVTQHIGHAAQGLLENLRGRGAIAYFSGMAIQDVHAASVVWQRYQSRKGLF